MKILYIVPNLYTLSGVTNVIMNYYRKIDKDRIQIDFLVIKKYAESVEKELLDSGSKIFYLKNKISIKNFKNAQKEIAHFYKNNKYDIVELHAPTFSFLFMKEAKEAKIPFRIIHTHSTSRSAKKIKNIVSFFMNINMKKYANIYFACSEKSGQYWFGKNISSYKNYHIITNGIDISNYKFDKNLRNKIRNELKLENNYVVGFVGRMSHDKNLFFLIDIMEEVISINPKIKLVVIGDGKIAVEVKKYANKLGDSVLFLGSRNDVNRLLNCFDLILLPSKREGLPMVAVEAQVSGIPCFLSDTITKEVDLGNAKFIPLSKQCWIKEILNFDNKSVKIDKVRFDIVECTKNLEQIYFEYYRQLKEESNNGI